jgi:hypothetical protein
MDRHHHGETWTELVLQRVSGIEHDLHGDSLHDLREVPRGVVGRQKRELRSAGRSDFRHFSVENDSGESVDLDFGRIAFSNVGKLRFLVICLNPDVPVDQIQELPAGRYLLPFLHVPLTDCASRRGKNARIAEIDVGDDDRRLPCLNAAL